MAHIETARVRVGNNKGRPRVWLDGARLLRAGFIGGTTYFYRAEAGRLVCQLERMEDPTGARKVTGRPDGKPIMDLTGSDVRTLLGDTGATHVDVTFEPGRITLTPSKEA
ncbi:hypothetical protein [Roseomonas sp. WA12]